MHLLPDKFRTSVCFANITVEQSMMKKFVRTKLKGRSPHEAAASDDNAQIASSTSALGPKHGQSYKTIENRTISDEQFRLLNDENDYLRGIINELRAQNTHMNERLLHMEAEQQQILQERPNLNHFQNEHLIENERLKKCLQLEKDHNFSLETNYRKELDHHCEQKRQMTLEKCEVEEALTKLSIKFEETLIKMDTLENDSKNKVRPEELEEIFQKSQHQLEKLKHNYQTELAELTSQLTKCESDKKHMALKFSETEHHLATTINENELLSAKLEKLTIDYDHLSRLIKDKDEKLIEIMKLVDDLMKCLTEQKSIDEKNKAQLKFLENKLKACVSQCRELKEQNKRLKQSKQVACSKLKRAKVYLEHDEDSSMSSE